jgi:hypothetical protein
MSVLPVRDRIRLWGKRLLFAGLDLHTRSRYRFLTRSFSEGPIGTLDVGAAMGRCPMRLIVAGIEFWA